MRIATHHDSLVTAHWHFANGATFDVIDDMDRLLDAVPGQADYIVVPCTATAGDYSPLVNQGAMIARRTPLVDVPGISPCFIIGSHEADASGADINLYSVVDGDRCSIVEVAAMSPSRCMTRQNSLVRLQTGRRRNRDWHPDRKRQNGSYFEKITIIGMGLIVVDRSDPPAARPLYMRL